MKKTIILDEKYFTIDGLLDGLRDHFKNENQEFEVIGKSSAPLIKVDGVKYRVTMGFDGGIALNCQKIVLKEEK